jgi:hypothetical protein
MGQSHRQRRFAICSSVTRGDLARHTDVNVPPLPESKKKLRTGSAKLRRKVGSRILEVTSDRLSKQ